METLANAPTLSTPTTSPSSWRWFLAWGALGSGLVVAIAGVLTIGIFVMPVVMIGTTWLAVRQANRPIEKRSFSSAWGMVSGMSLPIFLMAYANRLGPGTICTSTPTGSRCVQQYSPWPFTVIAVLLLAVGVSAHVVGRRLRRRANARATSQPLPGYVVTRETNSLAVVSLVMGIASIALSPPMGIAGLVTGGIARRQIRLARGTQVGSGLALAGILTSAVGVMILTTALLLLLLLRSRR